MTPATVTLPPPAPPSASAAEDSIVITPAVSSSGSTPPMKRSISEGETNDATLTNVQPVKKRARMTEAEKEEKRKEKEIKDEEKRREQEVKEEGKRREKEAKEEERRKDKEAKEKEKEAKKAEREEKKRAKDEEKRRKDEEKSKKERAQVRLDSFFKTPVTPKKERQDTLNTPLTASPSPPALKTEASPGPSATPTSGWDSKEQCTPMAKPRRCCDYHRSYLPFFVKQHMIVAPEQPFPRNKEARMAFNKAIDQALCLPQGSIDSEMDIDDAPVAKTKGISKEEVAELLRVDPLKLQSPRGNILPYQTKDIIARIENPDDPGLPPLWLGKVKPESFTSAHYVKLLNKLPNKFLKFAEDIRPPYSGTFIRSPTKHGLETGRNPFERALPGINYDYDSEAEWVADEDGEDLLSEDEDDKESEGGDSMDGFLDDEEDPGLKRNGMAVLMPTNSGMCWENASGKSVRQDLEEMRIAVLIDGVVGPIDPFSTKYWEPQGAAETSARSKTMITNMEPPQRPLLPNRPLAGAGSNFAPGKKDNGAKKFVPPEYLEDFKRAIDGSDMTKAGLIEQLKKAFPKVGKDHIRNSLDVVAERVGEKRDDKRWILK